MGARADRPLASGSLVAGGQVLGGQVLGGQVLGFAPYPAHGPGTFVPTPTFSAAVTAYYAAYSAAAPLPSAAGVQGGRALPAPARARAGPLAESAAEVCRRVCRRSRRGRAGSRRSLRPARANAAAALRRARHGVERRLAGLAADEPAPGAAQQLRTAAEWLLALASQVTRGQAVLAGSPRGRHAGDPPRPQPGAGRAGRAHVPPRRQARARRGVYPPAPRRAAGRPGAGRPAGAGPPVRRQPARDRRRPARAACGGAAGSAGVLACLLLDGRRQKTQEQPARSARVSATPAAQAGCSACAANRGWRLWWGATPGRTSA